MFPSYKKISYRCNSQNIFFILLGIIGVGFLIGFHELGHFLFCKLFGIRTPSFSIGFGPRLISRKIGDTIFSLSAIPLGGYVEIAGSAEMGQGEQKEAHTSDEGSFARKPYYQKLLVMLGGIAFNLIFAYCAFITIFLIGLPKTPHFFPDNAQPIINHIQDDSAADKGGLKIGDHILTVNGTSIEGNAATAINLIESLANQNITISVERYEKERTFNITVGQKESRDNKIVGSLGIGFEIKNVAGYSPLKAIKYGITKTNAVIAQTFNAFKGLFTGRNLNQMAGPIMIISMTAKSAGAGLPIFLFFLAIISINLAVLNLNPIPILDGGQILFYTIEAIIGRELPIKIKEYIHIACWVLLLGLILYLSTQDLGRMLKPLLTKFTSK